MLENLIEIATLINDESQHKNIPEKIKALSSPDKTSKLIKTLLLNASKNISVLLAPVVDTLIADYTSQQISEQPNQSSQLLNLKKAFKAHSGTALRRAIAGGFLDVFTSLLDYLLYKENYTQDTLEILNQLSVKTNETAIEISIRKFKDAKTDVQKSAFSLCIKRLLKLKVNITSEKLTEYFNYFLPVQEKKQDVELIRLMILSYHGELLSQFITNSASNEIIKLVSFLLAINRMDLLNMPLQPNNETAIELALKLFKKEQNPDKKYNYYTVLRGLLAIPIDIKFEKIEKYFTYFYSLNEPYETLAPTFAYYYKETLLYCFSHSGFPDHFDQLLSLLPPTEYPFLNQPLLPIKETAIEIALQRFKDDKRKNKKKDYYKLIQKLLTLKVNIKINEYFDYFSSVVETYPLLLMKMVLTYNEQLGSKINQVISPAKETILEIAFRKFKNENDPEKKKEYYYILADLLQLKINTAPEKLIEYFQYFFAIKNEYTNLLLEIIDSYKEQLFHQAIILGSYKNFFIIQDLYNGPINKDTKKTTRSFPINQPLSPYHETAFELALRKFKNENSASKRQEYFKIILHLIDLKVDIKPEKLKESLDCILSCGQEFPLLTLRFAFFYKSQLMEQKLYNKVLEYYLNHSSKEVEPKQSKFNIDLPFDRIDMSFKENPLQYKNEKVSRIVFYSNLNVPGSSAILELTTTQTKKYIHFPKNKQVPDVRTNRYNWEINDGVNIIGSFLIEHGIVDKSFSNNRNMPEQVIGGPTSKDKDPYMPEIEEYYKKAQQQLFDYIKRPLLPFPYEKIKLLLVGPPENGTIENGYRKYLGKTTANINEDNEEYFNLLENIHIEHLYAPDNSSESEGNIADSNTTNFDSNEEKVYQSLNQLAREELDLAAVLLVHTLVDGQCPGTYAAVQYMQTIYQQLAGKAGEVLVQLVSPFSILIDKRMAKAAGFNLAESTPFCTPLTVEKNVVSQSILLLKIQTPRERLEYLSKQFPKDLNQKRFSLNLSKSSYPLADLQLLKSMIQTRELIVDTIDCSWAALKNNPQHIREFFELAQELNNQVKVIYSGVENWVKTAKNIEREHSITLKESAPQAEQEVDRLSPAATLRFAPPPFANERLHS